jgi:hypothetical protein
MGYHSIILNTRHQSLYRRVFFSQSLSVSVLYTATSALKTKRKPTSFQSCPESIYTYYSVLGQITSDHRRMNGRLFLLGARTWLSFQACAGITPCPYLITCVYINTVTRELKCFLSCRLPLTRAVVHSFKFCTTYHPIRKDAPQPCRSFAFIYQFSRLPYNDRPSTACAPQVSMGHSRWPSQATDPSRLCHALYFLLSTLSGILGLVASQAWRVGDHSRETRATVSGKIVVVALQFGRKCIPWMPLRKKNSPAPPVSVYSMFILNLKALVEPIPSPRIGIVTLENVRGLTAVMSCPLVASSYFCPSTCVGVNSFKSTLVTVISTVFAALQEDYPAARFPVICWLVLFIPLFGVSILLYLYIRRAKEHPIIARLWLVFAAGQACGALSATCALVGKGDFQAPASLFDAFWSTCVTFAFHSASPVDPSLLRSLH